MNTQHTQFTPAQAARIESERPIDGVPEATCSGYELAAYRMPNGSRFVTLCDDTERTWEQYCAERVEVIAARGRAKITLNRKTKDKMNTPELLAALRTCVSVLERYPAHDPNGEAVGNMVPAAAYTAIAKAEPPTGQSLIAAAPELLAALKSLAELANDPAGCRITVRELFGTYGNSRPEIEGQQALDAIAKAEGAQ